ncbi:alpha/beta-hydrolase [Alternaria alternata]|nr:alpha/beta-hydrolase [Alternaria alternata]
MKIIAFVVKAKLLNCESLGIPLRCFVPKPDRRNEIERQQVRLAAEWAVRVHKIDKSSKDTIFHGTKDPTGNTRPFCLHKATVGGRATVVIAFRATRYPMYSPMQMAVNTNADPIACEELGVGMKVHRGFLSLAKSMETSVAAKLDELLATCLTDGVGLLFTGHSSGAAVAQLLFAFMHSESSPMARFKSHCITFGGPPVSNYPITFPSKKASLFMSFINEGDPVPLAQEEYMHSLVQAYTQPVTKTEWEVPRPFYLPSGDQVVLRYETHESGGAGRVVMLRVGCATLEGVLFGDIVMHSMSIYKDRIQKILEQLALSQDPFEDPQ